MGQKSSTSKETAEKFIKEDSSSSPEKYTVVIADELESFQFLFMCHSFNSNEEMLCEACEFAVCLLLFRI